MASLVAPAAADEEHAEAMEQVEGEELVGDAAAVEKRVEGVEQVGVEETAEAPAEEGEGEAAADDEPVEAMEQVEGEEEAEALRTALPLGRVKKIIRVDRDIRKVTAEASLLIAAATELFLGSLAAGAHTAAAQRGRRAVRAAHVRAAARAHRPTADFLLDCLPATEEAPRACSAADSGAAAVTAAEPKPLPRGTRRIDAFFQKAT